MTIGPKAVRAAGMEYLGPDTGLENVGRHVEENVDDFLVGRAQGADDLVEVLTVHQRHRHDKRRRMEPAQGKCVLDDEMPPAGQVLEVAGRCWDCSRQVPTRWSRSSRQAKG
jgi:hypothetical protein